MYRFALLFLTNKIERIPLFDIRQSTFDIYFFIFVGGPGVPAS